MTARTAAADTADSAESIGRVLCAAARHELARAGDCLAWSGSRLHLGVHQGRKSLRRTRAALALAAPALGASGRLVDRELNRLLEDLSELRDGQALVEVLRAVDGKLPDGHARLLARVLRVAERRRAELAHHFGGVAVDHEGQDLLATLHAALAGMPWDRVDAGEVAWMLRDSDARVAEAIISVRGDPDDDENWHDWRRRMRRRTQQQRLLAGTALVVERGPAHAVAERLGAAQDLVLLLAHCGDDSPFADADRRDLAKLVRKLQARERAALLVQAAKLEKPEDPDDNDADQAG